MKRASYKKIINITIVSFIAMLFFRGECFAQEVATQQDVSKNRKQVFDYEQSKVSNTIKKDLKMKIAVFVAEDNLKVKGSLFNPLGKRIPEKKNVKIDNSKVEIRIEKEEENKKHSDAQLITGLLVSALDKTGKFIIVERKDVNAILREIDFEHSKWVTKDQANKIGNIYGVKYILIANLLKNESGDRISGNSYTITTRLCDVNTGSILSSGVGEANTIKDTVGIAVKDLVSSINNEPWTCRVVKIEKDGIYLNSGKDEGLRKKDVLDLYKIKGEILDPETKKALGVDKQKVGTIEIEEVLNVDLSKARILEQSESISTGFIAQAKSSTDTTSDEIAKWKNIFGNSLSGDNTKKDPVEKNNLSDVSLSIEAIVENAGPAVVLITTIGNNQSNLGSGFIVSPDGLVVTNFHVIKEASAVGVKLAKNNEIVTNVKVIKTDPFRDIAILKIGNPENLPSVALGDSDQVIVGERVIAIGNPQGLENTVSDGLVSAIRDVEQGYKLIQISAPISQGSSGGALLNMRGEIIGVTSSKLEGGENLNFAIPINYVKEEVERL